MEPSRTPLPAQMALLFSRASISVEMRAFPAFVAEQLQVEHQPAPCGMWMNRLAGNGTFERGIAQRADA